jgi:AraC family transcriptional regulator
MLAAVLTYINHHLEEEVSLDTLAQVTGYSPFHLHRMLREELAEPIGSFIVRQRMQKAGYLLAMTRIPVSEIQFLVGYANSSAFSRAFKKAYGTTPTNFRRSKAYPPSLNEDNYVSLKPEIIRLPARKGIIFPTMANYFQNDSYSVWSGVQDFMAEKGLDREAFDYYAVLHDCQNIQDERPLRYDAALVAKGPLTVPVPRHMIADMPSGRFIKYRFCCPVSGYKATADQINRHIAESSGVEHIHGASCFRFTELPLPEAADHLLIEWYIPIK